MFEVVVQVTAWVIADNADAAESHVAGSLRNHLEEFEDSYAVVETSLRPVSSFTAKVVA
jgi:hypothetical protein